MLKRAREGDGYQRLQKRLVIQDALAQLFPGRSEAIQSLVTDRLQNYRPVYLQQTLMRSSELTYRQEHWLSLER